ncbi:class I SAM-dependent methyltransferase [Salinifilum ghardaiensis]
MTTTSSEQIREAWDALAPRFDEFTTTEWTLPFGEELLDRIDLHPGAAFLDVACGSGALAVPAARRGAHVVAVDIAPAMIELLRARAEAAGVSDVDGLVMDGEALELPADTFDISASLNGVSLFPDVRAGLREVARVTKPGGRVLIAAFGALRDAEFLAVFLGALRASVPGFAPPPMDPPPLPFQLADPARLHSELVDAGLADVHVDPVTWERTFPSAERFWDVVTASNPIAAQLTRGLSDAQRTEVKQVLDGMFREKSGGRPEAVISTGMNIGTGTA